MAIGANSYGSVAGVAVLTPIHATETGTYTTRTRPTLTQVETFIDEVSAALNIMLSTVGFTIPISDADVTPLLDMFVNQEVASIIEGMKGSGRFGPTRDRGRPSRFAVIHEDVATFVENYALGIERQGAARSNPITAGLAFREYDEAGDKVHPLFQRKGFGNVSTNWDVAND